MLGCLDHYNYSNLSIQMSDCVHYFSCEKEQLSSNWIGTGCSLISTSLCASCRHSYTLHTGIIYIKDCHIDRRSLYPFLCVRTSLLSENILPCPSSHHASASCHSLFNTHIHHIQSYTNSLLCSITFLIQYLVIFRNINRDGNGTGTVPDCHIISEQWAKENVTRLPPVARQILLFLLAPISGA